MGYQKRLSCVLLALIMCLSLLPAEAEETVTRLEAEKAEKTGTVLTALQQKAIGKSITGTGDSLIFTLDIPQDGFYDLTVHCFSTGGTYKENYVKVDGESVGMLVTDWFSYADAVVPRIYMTQGTHIPLRHHFIP